MSSEYEKINLLTKLRMEAWEKGNKYDDENNYKKANEELEKYGMLLEIEKDYCDWLNNKKTSNGCDGIEIIDDVYNKNFVNERFKELDTGIVKVPDELMKKSRRICYLRNKRNLYRKGYEICYYK